MKTYRITSNIAFFILTAAIVLILVSASNYPALRTAGSAAGLLAFYFLLFSVALGPAAMFFPRLSRLIIYRRDVGLWAFYLSAAHFIAHFIVIFNSDISRVFGNGIATIAGLAALLIIIPPAATSFDYAVKKLGPKKWKTVQRLVYPVVLLVAIHIAIALTRFIPIYMQLVPGWSKDIRPAMDTLFIYLPLATTVILQIAGFLKRKRIQKRSDQESAA